MAWPALPDEAEAALRRFRSFYAELYAVQRALQENDVATLLGQRPPAEGLAAALAHAVQMRLRRALAAAQSYRALRVAAGPGEIDPGYAMTAVADEVLLHEVAWPGREIWAETPLELLLYRSRLAGDRIFEAIHELAATRAADPDGLAMTLLLALRLGFRGRYRAGDGDPDRMRENDAAIARETQRLQALVFRGADAGMDDAASLVGGAAEPLAARVRPSLPQLRPWLIGLGGIAAGYLVVSWLIWLAEVGDILDGATRVSQSLRALP